MAELGLTRGVDMGNVGEGLEDNARTSPGEEREAIERGQEMDLLIGPDSVGEAGGAELVLSDLIGAFQSIRPIKEEKGGKVGAMIHCHTKFLLFPFFILILRTSHCSLFCLQFHSWMALEKKCVNKIPTATHRGAVAQSLYVINRCSKCNQNQTLSSIHV